MSPSPRLPWYALLTAVVVVPLAVGIVPLAGTRFTLNIFVQAKLVVLALTLALATAAWGFTVLRERTLYTGRALIPLGVVVLVGALSTAFAADPRLAAFGDFEQGVGFLVVSLCCLVCLLTTQLVRDNELLASLTSAVVWTASAVAGIGLLQQLLAFDVLGLGPGLLNSETSAWVLRRGFGTIGNADTYAAYLVLPALLALHRLAGADSTRNRGIWGASFVAISASLVAAQTRAALVGLVLGAAVYFIVRRRIVRGLAAGGRTTRTGSSSTTPGLVVGVIAAIGVIVGVTLATMSGSLNNLAGRFGSLAALTSLGGRLPLWRSAVEIATAHPILGIGPDSFRLGWYPTRQISHLIWGAGLIVTDPHSLPLEIAATMGILGHSHGPSSSSTRW